MIREITWPCGRTSIRCRLILQTNYSAVRFKSYRVKLLCSMSRIINNCPLKAAANYLFHNYRSVLELKSHKCTVCLSMPLWLSLTLCWKCKRSRIMDLWWAVGNTLKADCGRPMQAWLSVIAHKWSWLGGTAALCSISCSGLQPYCPLTPPCLTATAWPLRNLTPRLLAAPPGTCQPFTPSLGEHLEGEEGQTRRPWWAVVKYWHGNR